MHAYRIWEKDSQEHEDDTLTSPDDPATVALQYAQDMADSGNYPDHIGHPLHLYIRNTQTQALHSATIGWDYHPVAFVETFNQNVPEPITAFQKTTPE